MDVDRFWTESIDGTHRNPPPGWRVQVTRLAAGPYAYSFGHVRIDDGLDVGHTKFVGPVHVAGTFVADAIHVMFPYGEDVRVQGARMTQDVVVVTPRGAAFDATGRVASGGFGVGVGGALLAQLVRECRFHAPAGRSLPTPANTVAARRLRATVVDLLQDATAPPEERRRLEFQRQQLLESLASVLGSLSLRRSYEPATCGAKRRELACAASRLIHEHASAGLVLTQGELCRALGTSARTLQLAFQEAYGVGFRSFERAVRLAEAHRLLRERGDDCSVTDVALRCGFWHLGRFAGYHRRVFGMAPSDVPARRADSAPRS